MALTSPLDFFFQWHLTERCNLACRHCYQEGGPGLEMSLFERREVVEEVFETLAAWAQDHDISFSPAFNITGGEPLLIPDLLPLLAEIASRGAEVHLLTNGTLIDRDRARELARAGIKGVQVSIEGPEEVHDHLRGRGSFAAALRGVRALLEKGHVVTLNTTLSAANADAFPEMIDLARTLGVQKLGCSRLVPYGRGREMLSLALPADRVKEIYREFFAAEQSALLSGLSFVTGDPVASCLRAGAETGPGGDVMVGGCAAGLSGLTILPDGTVLPCRRLPLPLGNLRTDSLREIWADSPILARLRDRSLYRGRCGSCPRWSVCRGCRAIAYAHAAAHESQGGDPDYLADDPGCFL